MGWAVPVCFIKKKTARLSGFWSLTWSWGRALAPLDETFLSAPAPTAGWEGSAPEALPFGTFPL